MNVGDSITATSPGSSSALQVRSIAWRAPEVTMISSASVAKPVSRPRMAICSRSAGTPSAVP